MVSGDKFKKLQLESGSFLQALQGFRVKEGLNCLFSVLKQTGKAHNLAIP